MYINSERPRLGCFRVTVGSAGSGTGWWFQFNALCCSSWELLNVTCISAFLLVQLVFSCIQTDFVSHTNNRCGITWAFTETADEGGGSAENVA